jgi:hypothetical protein
MTFRDPEYEDLSEVDADRAEIFQSLFNNLYELYSLGHITYNKYSKIRDMLLELATRGG